MLLKKEYEGFNGALLNTFSYKKYKRKLETSLQKRQENVLNLLLQFALEL